MVNLCCLMVNLCCLMVNLGALCNSFDGLPYDIEVC